MDAAPSPPVLNRRRFLASTTATTVAAALGAAPAMGRVLGANDRIHFGVIGAGGMGSIHVQDLMQRERSDNVRCVAVSDVYQKRLNAAKVQCHGSGYLEYERLISDPNVDAVIIATPDHWHAKMAIDAMEAGKDVYLQKPMTLTIEQAFQVRDAVHRTKRKLQVGTQYASDPQAWSAHDAIAMGKIGKVVWSQAGYCRNSREGQFNWPIDPAAGPNAIGENYIDWDRWLGHKYGLAPRIPFNADRFFRFRKYWDYNGGVATDLLYHALAPILISVRGPKGEYPRKVSTGGGLYIEKDGREIPDSFFMLIDYPSEHTVFLSSVMTNDVGLPRLIRGHLGTIEFPREGPIRLQGQEAWLEEFKSKNGNSSVEIAAEPRRDHLGNFIDAVRGAADLACDAELGCALMVAIKMGVESYRQGKTMFWNPAKQRMSSGPDGAISQRA